MLKRLVPAVVFAFGVLADARAGVIEVSPILVQMNSADQTTTIMMTNRGDEATTVQVRPVEWSQVDGEDVTRPTTDLVLSPPIFSLPPGQSQVVRILRRASAVDLERSYRLLADEIPPKVEDGKVRFALRISLPVFVDNERTAAKPPVDFTLRRADDGSVDLVATNSGVRRTRVIPKTVTTFDGKPVELTNPPTPWLLAGATRAWKIKSPAAPTALRFTADSDFGPLTEDVHF